MKSWLTSLLVKPFLSAPMPRAIFPLLLLLVLGVYCLALQQLKGKASLSPLPYQAPRTAPARFAVQQLLPKAKPLAAAPAPRPRHPAAPQRAPAKPGWVTYEGVARSQRYFRASAYCQQRVRHGSGITLRLEEDCALQGLTLARGTRLFGKVRFGKDRVFIEVHTAESANAAAQRVALQGYELDYNQGLYFKGISDWQVPQEQLAGKALHHTTGLLHDVGDVALKTWRRWQRKQEVKLPEGRLLWLAPKEADSD